MLKLMRSDDSAAENSFTGIETRPKAICAVAMALGMTTPQHSQHIVCFISCFVRGDQILCRLPAVNANRQKIYAAVRRVPKGRVTTYGAIADLAGLDGHARQVGYALNDLPSGSNVPWHRVVNARGEISPRSRGD